VVPGTRASRPPVTRRGGNVPTDAEELVRLRREIDSLYYQLQGVRQDRDSMRRDRDYWRKKYIASVSDPDREGYA